MNIELHGTGRAAGALGLAASRAGHAITAVVGRNDTARAAMDAVLEPTGDAPDLRIIAVADDAIGDVVASRDADRTVPTVHVSGSVGVDVLEPLRPAAIGSFHPLQTLPDPESGAERLAGAWIAVTADEALAGTLNGLAESLGAHPFRLADTDKALYHAAAAASANFTLAALGVAERLYREAGVPFEAAHPLVDAIVANAFRMGPSAALTGPIARGDVGTVERQLLAVADRSSAELAMFRDLARATARYVDAPPAMREVIQ